MYKGRPPEGGRGGFKIMEENGHGGGGVFKIVDENGHGGRGGSGRMDVQFSGPSKIQR